MSKELNVWYIHTHEPWYRIDRKLTNVGRKIKWSFQRITRGFCDYDVFDLDQHYCRYIRDTILHLNTYRIGHPIGITDEEWSKILLTISDCFDKAQAEVQNKYEDDYFVDWSMKGDVSKVTKDKYFKEEERIEIERHKSLNQGLELLTKYFNDLWD